MNIVKSSLIAVVMLAGVFGIGQSALAGPSAGSYDVNITCGSFNNDQAAAQAYFDANDQPANLDQNGDGQACADPSDGDFSSTGPSAGSYNVNITCESFNNDQAAAQVYFDENDQPANLDQNADGIACNDAAVVADAPVVQTETPDAVVASALPNTGVGITSPSTDFTSVFIAMGLALIAGAAAATAVARRS